MICACNTCNKKYCFVEGFGVCKEGFQKNGGGIKVIVTFITWKWSSTKVKLWGHGNCGQQK